MSDQDKTEEKLLATLRTSKSVNEGQEKETDKPAPVKKAAAPRKKATTTRSKTSATTKTSAQSADNFQSGRRIWPD